MNSLSKIPSIRGLDLRGKVVLIRVDHNVVKKGVIKDAYRIDSTFATIAYVLSRGGKIILATHVGRPRDKKTGAIKIFEESSVKPIVDYIYKKLGLKLEIPSFKIDGDKGYSGVDATINFAIDDLKSGKIDGIYLPNVRWFAGEESKGEDRELFEKQLAALADVYVNDAFGSWQPHASTVGPPKYLPACAGLLMEKELENLSRVYNPKTPFLAVVAGAKFDTKIDTLFALLEKADYLILGGVLYNAYIAAKYGVSIKGISEEDVASARKFAAETEKRPGKLIELPFAVESETMEGKIEGKYRTIDIRALKGGENLNYVLDVAAKSFEEPEVREKILSAKTIFANAVMGYAPHFNEGTIAMHKIFAEAKDAMKLYGGGDTLQELKRLLPGTYLSALDDPKYYMFTGGGAVLKAIQEGSPFGLEPVKALIKE